MKDNSTMTAGVDIGDKYSQICLLDEFGEVVENKRIASVQSSFIKYFGSHTGLVIAMETGSHSPWMSRLLEEIGHRVIVANSRRVALISQSHKKTDLMDAELLARLARADLNLLSPVEHRNKSFQEDIAVIRGRDALVRSRTLLVNHIRGVVKSNGDRLPQTATARFHKLDDQIPKELAPGLAPLMKAIEAINTQINEADKAIEKLCDKYPITKLLQTVPGIGSLTAFVFVMVVIDPKRFHSNRDVGPYLGLTPSKHQSGTSDPGLGISKAGNIYLRRLLVNAAHYVMGPFGPDTMLRRWGFSIIAKGGETGRKKAVIGVARKLAVILLAMWKTGKRYEPGVELEEQPPSPLPSSESPLKKSVKKKESVQGSPIEPDVSAGCMKPKQKKRTA